MLDRHSSSVFIISKNVVQKYHLKMNYVKNGPETKQKQSILS